MVSSISFYKVRPSYCLSKTAHNKVLHEMTDRLVQHLRWFPHLCGASTAACVRVSVCLWTMRSWLLLQVSLQGLHALPLKHSPGRGLAGWRDPHLLKPRPCGLQLTWNARSDRQKRAMDKELLTSSVFEFSCYKCFHT